MSVRRWAVSSDASLKVATQPACYGDLELLNLLLFFGYLYNSLRCISISSMPEDEVIWDKEIEVPEKWIQSVDDNVLASIGHDRHPFQFL